MGFFLLKKLIPPNPTTFKIFNNLIFSEFIPPSARSFVSQFLLIKLNLLIPKILLFEYFLVINKGDKKILLQPCSFFLLYSNWLCAVPIISQQCQGPLGANLASSHPKFPWFALSIRLKHLFLYQPCYELHFVYSIHFFFSTNFSFMATLTSIYIWILPQN